DDDTHTDCGRGPRATELLERAADRVEQQRSASRPIGRHRSRRERESRGSVAGPCPHLVVADGHESQCQTSTELDVNLAAAAEGDRLPLRAVAAIADSGAIGTGMVASVPRNQITILPTTARSPRSW